MATPSFSGPQTDQPQQQPPNAVIKTKLQLVDLAGSECVGKKMKNNMSRVTKKPTECLCDQHASDQDPCYSLSVSLLVIGFVSE
jgi:hypothetical protein